MGRLNSKALLSGAWTLGKFAYGAAQNAERQRQAEAMRRQADQRKTVLLAQNTPLTGMAEPHELDAYRYRLDGLYLGRIHEDHGTAFEAGITDDRHAFLMAQSRSGKGRSIGVQNAIRWPGPLFMIDPKGETASITAMRRGTAQAAKGTGTLVRNFLGQNVAILDPFAETVGPARMRYRVRYNPLADIDMTRPGWDQRIWSIGEAVVAPEEGPGGEHFTESAQSILRGIIETAKLREPPERQTLPQCRRTLSQPYEQVVAYLRLCPLTPAGFAADALSVIEELGINEWGSFRSTLSRNLAWLSSPEMQDHLGHSPFSLWRAIQERGSVFIVLPPNIMGRFKRWMRLVVKIALDAKTALGTNQSGLPTLFLLDEFPLLGNFQIIEESAGALAGYNIKLVPMIQDLSQLRAHYPRSWETFLGNAGAIIAFALNDRETERYLSDRMGRVMVWENSFGVSGGVNEQDAIMAVGSGNTGLSENIAQRERMVRFPNQIRAEAARETMRAFVIPSGNPFMIRRQNYDAIATPGLFDPPGHISAWERRYGNLKKSE